MTHHHHAAGFLALVEEARPRVKEISVAEYGACLMRHEQHVLIDVREDHEWARGHLPGAMHLGRGILERDIESLLRRPRDTHRVLLRRRLPQRAGRRQPAEDGLHERGLARGRHPRLADRGPAGRDGRGVGRGARCRGRSGPAEPPPVRTRQRTRARGAHCPRADGPASDPCVSFAGPTKAHLTKRSATTMAETQAAPWIGTFIWNELGTGDIAAARSLLASLLGWTAEVRESEPGGTYTVFRSGDKRVGGGSDLKGEKHRACRRAGCPTSAWRAPTRPASSAERLGMRIQVPPTDIPAGSLRGARASRDGDLRDPRAPAHVGSRRRDAPAPRARGRGVFRRARGGLHARPRGRARRRARFPRAGFLHRSPPSRGRESP